MSKTKKSVSLFEDVLSLMRRKWTEVVIGDETLSESDTKVVHEAFALNAMLWSDVIGEKLFSRRDLLSWVARLCTAGLDCVLKVFKFTDLLLISGECDTLGDLLSHLDNEFPSVGWSLLSPLRWQLCDFFSSQRIGHAACLRDIRTCLLFTSKLTLTSYSKAEEQSFEKFERNMERIESVSTLPSEYMKSWVADLYPSSEQEFLRHFSPKHGSGSVAERQFVTVSKHGKTVSHAVPCNELYKWRLTPTPAVNFLLTRAGIRPLPLQSLTKTNRVARLSSVPKGIDERRIICMEPISLMFLQQGVAHALDFNRTKLRSHVDLRDASKSAALAQEGSESGKYATIDLSSASDSVRWNFVWHLFEKRPYLQRLMLLCRSTHREYPDGHVARNVHFAPMGSALCFPVEVIVFSAIVEEAIHLCGGGFSRYRVYGDDIVVEERYYQKVVDLLEYYGFVVNHEKTYHGDQPFREACGGHYFLGEDVTPYRLSKQFSGLRTRKATSVSRTIDLANRTFGRYCTLRKVLVHELMKAHNYELACTTDPADTTKLLVDVVYPTIDCYTDRKAGKGAWYQLPERKCLVVTTTEDHSMLKATDALLYWKALSRESSTPSQTATDVYAGTRDCKLSRRWTKCL